MRQIRTLKRATLIGLPIFAGAVAISGASHYRYSDLDYTRQDGTRVLSDVDYLGFAGHTELTIHTDGKIRVKRTGGFFGQRRIFYDNNGDSFVDEIFIGGKHFVRGLNGMSDEQEEHSESLIKLFSQADKSFSKQLERFGISPVYSLGD